MNKIAALLMSGSLLAAGTMAIAEQARGQGYSADQIATSLASLDTTKHEELTIGPDPVGFVPAVFSIENWAAFVRGRSVNVS